LLIYIYIYIYIYIFVCVCVCVCVCLSLFDTFVEEGPRGSGIFIRLCKTSCRFENHLEHLPFPLVLRFFS
jgi:hypothetical protein